ncbi:MAG TPA: oligosaccharide flippase family protein [Candidatus Latescibacteria bacterium]|nr:oligosaccharide flippase family protein [Candidatus Latescibacterota bacterium]HQI75423.1 oligosaccharide flippase family protein [Candidatus Latescibacterota bacterium]
MNTRRLTGEAAVYTFGIVLDTLAPFLVLPILGRYLTPGQFGLADVITATAGLTYFAVGFNLDQALTRYYYDEEDAHRKRLVTTHLAVVSVSGTVFLVLGLVGLHAFRGSLQDLSAWHWALLSVPLMVMSDQAATLFRLQHQPFKQLGLLSVRAFVWVFFTSFFLVWLRAGISSIFIGRVAGAIFGLGASAYALRRLYALRGNLRFAVRALRFSLPTLPAAFASWGLVNAARYFLVIGASAEETGYYGVGVRLTYIVSTIGIGVVMAWGPFFMGIKEEPNAREIQARGLLYFIAANVVCIAPLLMFAREAVLLLMGSQYLPAVRLVGPMLAATLFSNLSLFLFVQISVSERTHWQSVSYAVGLVVMVIANVLLVPAMKGMGAAIAMLCGHLATAGTMWFAGQRVYTVPVSVARVGILILVLAGCLVLAPTTTTRFGTTLQGIALRALLTVLMWSACLAAVGPGDVLRFAATMVGKRT